MQLISRNIYHLKDKLIKDDIDQITNHQPEICTVTNFNNILSFVTNFYIMSH